MFIIKQSFEMKKKNSVLFIAIGIFAIIAAWVVLARVLTPEDSWVCDNGKWVKHGNPSAEKPTSGCGDDVSITNFDECVAAGNPVMESYPRQCSTEDGESFVEDIGNELVMTDYITVDNPRPNTKIVTSFVLTGEARGTWFYEASFPVKLYDDNDEIVFQGVVTAQGDWMTEDLVPFQAEILFNKPSTEKGLLVLEKSNPSGLDEENDSLEIPVKF